MAYNYEYPYTDPNRFNVDWLLNAMKNLTNEMKNFVSLNSVKWHDPLQWNITTQYERLEIVKNDGTAYLSKRPVPLGVAITNEEYWQEIGDFDIDSDTIRENIATSNEHDNLIATENHLEDSLMWWHDDLYVCLADISTGTAFAPNVNVLKTTCEEYFNDKINAIWFLFTNELTLNDLTVNGDTVLKGVEVDGDLSVTGDTVLKDTEIDGDLKIDNDLKYKTPDTLDEYFKTVPYVGADGNTYNLLVQTPSTEILAENTSLWLRPEMYGAVGDGVTDDTEAFKQCFAESIYSTRYILLTQRYKITEYIPVLSNTYVLGLGAVFVDSINKDTPDPVTRYYPYFYCDNVENVVIDGLSFEGATSTTSTLNRVCNIRLYQSSAVEIRNCTFSKLSCADNIDVEECSNILIDNNNFSYHKYTAIGVYSSSNIRIINNSIKEQGLTYINVYGIALTYWDLAKGVCRDVWVENNHIEYDVTISTWEAIDAHGGYNITVQNNTIRNAQYGVAILDESAYGRGFEMRYCRVSGNIIENTGDSHTGNWSSTYGICVGGLFIDVSNNIIRRIGVTKSTTPSTSCCSINCLAKNQYVRIHDNQFIFPYGVTISLNGVTDSKLTAVEIINNFFDVLTTQNGLNYTVYVGINTSFDRSLIRNNTFLTSARFYNDNGTIVYPLEFRDNNYQGFTPTWSGISSFIPDVVTSAQVGSVTRGYLGCKFRVADVSSGGHMWYAHNGTSWVAM